MLRHAEASLSTLRAQAAKRTVRDVEVTLTQARRYLGATITTARINREPVTITDHGKPVATLVPVLPAQEVPADPQAR
jgi:prevent-host-death family protein